MNVLRPPVGVLHAAHLSERDEVFERLGLALLALRLDPLGAVNFGQFTGKFLHGAAHRRINVIALRTGRRGLMDAVTVRALAGRNRRLVVFVILRPLLFPMALKGPFAVVIRQAVAAPALVFRNAVAGVVEDERE
ncbi:hypothetical protein EOA27_32065, partial [Mesorhizobium sp. M2A.F.Ca.ET.037.01.1.1]